MSNRINDSKLTIEYLFGHLNIDDLTKKHHVTRATVVKSILSFLKKFPESKHYSTIYGKLKLEITKNFLTHIGRMEDFAEEYGFNKKAFVDIMLEVIEDTKLISSSILADKIFRKLTADIFIKAAHVPTRIVQMVANYYTVTTRPLSQRDLAYVYGMDPRTIAAILRRGIAENILSDVVSEKVYVRVKNTQKINRAQLDAFDAAFDKRALNKAKT